MNAGYSGGSFDSYSIDRAGLDVAYATQLDGHDRAQVAFPWATHSLGHLSRGTRQNAHNVLSFDRKASKTHSSQNSRTQEWWLLEELARLTGLAETTVRFCMNRHICNPRR